uniref:Piwi domain-containing protein n=2 Tax=Oryza TaxID=4527 RepID=A0A0D3F187_9ORYZ
MTWLYDRHHSLKHNKAERQAILSTYRLAKRPNLSSEGMIGESCIVRTNCFSVHLESLDDQTIYEYDVCVTPEVGINRAVIRELVKQQKDSGLGGRLPAYDGRKRLYTSGPLPFDSHRFLVLLDSIEDSPEESRHLRVRDFVVTLKFAAKISLWTLRKFRGGKPNRESRAALRALDVVLKELPTARYTQFAGSFYSPNLGECRQLCKVLESWRGFHQRIQATQMGLQLNIDVSSSVFIKPVPVVDYVAQLLNEDILLDRPLCSTEFLKIKEALEGLKVQINGNLFNTYHVQDLVHQAASFPVNFSIQYPSLPCLKVAHFGETIFLPLEVCKIAEGQCHQKQLNAKHMAALLQVARQPPNERDYNILQTVHQNKYQEDPHAKEFGIKIEEKLVSIKSRILPAPWLKFHDSGETTEFLPQLGIWNMMHKKMINGGRVKSWACVNFCWSVREYAARNFCYDLGFMCRESGMVFSVKPVLPLVIAKPGCVESALRTLHDDVMDILRPQGRKLDLLIVILPNNNGSLYGDVKRICETDIGLISQCCLAKHVLKMNKWYLASVALKINAKMGGRNTVLVDALEMRLPHVRDTPTIVFGAHVTHPHPGKANSSSIAAVVASQDWPEVTKYAGLISVQACHQESIQGLFKVQDDPERGTTTSGMIKEHLMSFYRATKRKPGRIIFYRDGVSKGQLPQALMHELGAIKMACASMGPDYNPLVTYVVLQKCRHTRLFADYYNANTHDSTANIRAGTVVDSNICQPNQFDFYLCSHRSTQGTKRPRYYHVLWDENDFLAGSFQELTNYLCYTSATCTQSISVVAPVHCARLLSSRARCYIKPRSIGDSTSHTSLPSEEDSSAASETGSLLPIKDNLKGAMFFC